MADTHTYCSYVSGLDADNVHRHYHDHEYGFPILSDEVLFGRLLLEINQAGLSWTTILHKKENFRKAYAGFNIKKVAAFTQADRERLLADAGIIRNKLKVNAAIHNAQVIVELQKAHGSFKAWLDLHHPLSREAWVKLFKKTFKFTGGEITNEFLLSSGYLPGSHADGCEAMEKIKALNPPWMRGS